jgi:hypothetical protein
MFGDPLKFDHIADGAKPTRFQRACGYTYTSKEGSPVVFVPPDADACFRWLAGRHGWPKRMAGDDEPAPKAARSVSKAELARLVDAVKASVKDDPLFANILGAAP